MLIPDRHRVTAPLAIAAVFAGAATAALASTGPRQVPDTQYVPNVVSGGYTTTLMARSPDASGPKEALGIVGFGESAVELQSLASRSTSVRIHLRSTAGFDDVTAIAELDAGGAGVVVLRSQPGVTFSNYTARVAGEGPVGVVARARWSGGAEAAVEAPLADESLVLPLFARDVYSHTTILWIQNTSSDARAEVEARMFDRTGAPMGSWTFTLPEGLAGMVDPLYYFEFENLPVNAVNGFLGAMWFESDSPIAVQAYGDEPEGRGAAAFAAVPVSHAADRLLLPLVNGGPAAFSLIGVTNVGDDAVDVTIDYGAAPDSPSGPDARFQQTFRVAPRSSAFVDLDLTRHRGNRPPPQLPQPGFVGSAVVSATGPVVAAVLDQTQAPGIRQGYRWPPVLASHAYNGVRESDAGTAHAVPRVFDRVAGRTTRIVAQNPSAYPIAVEVHLKARAGAELGGSGAIAVRPHGSVSWQVSLPEAGEASALIRASAPVAILAVDGGADVDSTAYRPVPMPDELIDLPTVAPPPTETPGITPSPIPQVPRLFLPWSGRDTG